MSSLYNDNIVNLILSLFDNVLHRNCFQLFSDRRRLFISKKINLIFQDLILLLFRGCQTSKRYGFSLTASQMCRWVAGGLRGVARATLNVCRRI